MKYYQVRQYSRFCKSDISVTRFDTFQEAEKEYYRVRKLGYSAELSEVIILK